MTRHSQRPLFCLLLAAAGLLVGCTPTTALTQGRNTSLDAVDLVAMTDQMARSLAAAPGVRAAYAEAGPLIVVVQPVENQLTGEVLPAGQADLFTARVRSLLANHARETFTWVMNRDAFRRLQGRERDLDLGPAPERLQPQYALTATFRSLTDETTRQRTAAYLCVYQLASLADGRVLWTDRYEVKKTAVKGFLD
jgi:TolB-like protein